MKPIDLEIADYFKMVDLFRDESDRGAALLAGSYVENQVRLLLQSKLVQPKLEKELFGVNGPFSTLSQCISTFAGFGFLSSSTCARINIIRKIRNHFAHHPMEASSSIDPIKNQVLSSHTFQGLKKKDENDAKLDNLKLVYLLECSAIVALIYEAIHNA